MHNYVTRYVNGGKEEEEDNFDDFHLTNVVYKFKNSIFNVNQNVFNILPNFPALRRTQEFKDGEIKKVFKKC